MDGERDPARLGRRIRELRAAQDISQTALAAEARITPGYLSRLESGERIMPSIFVARRIAAALGITFNELLEITEE